LARFPAHYAALQCAPGASLELLKAAYYRLATEFHPDKHGGQDKGFTAVTAAWTALRERHSRAEYDRQLAARGLNCAVCAGRGVTYRQVTFVRREEVQCTACGGTGRNDLGIPASG
jgi:DnaJ-class molecular chaperone